VQEEGHCVSEVEKLTRGFGSEQKTFFSHSLHFVSPSHIGGRRPEYFSFFFALPNQVFVNTIVLSFFQ